jgi:serine/threonine protein kinase
MYEIQSALGTGGMGEVYRAQDTRLRRVVALKILPAAFAADADRLARFEREAQVLASLNHPHIAAIYGIEDAQEVHALVLELVEGPTLGDRVASGRLQVDEALSIARQIADALGASHEHGIIHRDLKPANIKVRPDGTVKVLDFGLARIMDSNGADEQIAGQSQSPTITSPAVTRAGTILGTAAYMAPEQATGKTADARSDIWAFGLVLFEMLTGRRGFPGETTVEVLSNVLKTEPDWTALPTTTPPAIRSLLRRCLQKDPARRLRDIVDARFQIEEALSEPAGVAPIDTSSFGRRTRERRLWGAALMIAALAGVAGGARYFRTTQTQPDEVRLEINAPPTTDPTSLAVSPDGKTIVFVASAEGTSRLWLRPLNGLSARPLDGTENARFPFWSPDSRSIGFSAVGQLKRVDLASGSVRVLASGRGMMGGTWNRDGTILFDGGVGLGLFVVSADGGAPTAVVMSVSAVNSFDTWFPQFLPDHRHYLFYATGSKPGIYVALLGATEIRQLLDAESAAIPSTERLLFVRQGILLSQAFDPARLEVTGSPAAVSEHILVNAAEQSGALSAALGGPVVYRTGNAGGQTQLVWLDRSGKVLDTVGGSELTDITTHALSRDGRRVAFARRVGGTTDIWLVDMDRLVPSRLTYDPGNDSFPVWSSDDSRVAWGSTRNGKVDIFVKPSDGTGREALLFGGHRGQGVSDWSPDGRFVLYHAVTRPTGNNQDIWAAPIADSGKPFPVVESEMSDEINGQFSPDGQWIAYQSNETGRNEIYVQPFRGPGRKLRVSNGGGAQARWRHDGRELFYIAPGNRFMSAAITIDRERQSQDVGMTATLFVANLPGDPDSIVGRHYAVSPDNQRFLVNTRKEVTVPITVILNWKPD